MLSLTSGFVTLVFSLFALQQDRPFEASSSVMLLGAEAMVGTYLLRSPHWDELHQQRFVEFSLLSSLSANSGGSNSGGESH